MTPKIPTPIAIGIIIIFIIVIGAGALWLLQGRNLMQSKLSKLPCNKIIVKSIKTEECKIFACENEVPAEIGADMVADHPPYEWVQVNNCSDDINKISDISGWQTYRNEKYGFEVKYPVDYKLKNEEGKDKNLFVNFEKKYYLSEGDFKEEIVSSFMIIVEESKYLDINEWFKNSKEPKESVEYIQIANRPAIKTISGSPFFSKNIFVINNNYLYVISGPFQVDKNEDFFNQILSTFRFIGVNNEETPLSLDKTAYNRGEEVKAILKLSEGAFIRPGFELFKFEKNNWNLMGSFSFTGDQITCCGVIPSSEKMKTPINISWNQKLVPQEYLPVIPPKKNSQYEKQADSGRYKIKVIYGSQSAYFDNSADAEFIIK